MRNPKWSRDELILPLDLYFRVNPIHPSDENPEIIALSETLNSLPLHPQSQHGEKFRNPNGVYMKLCNFLRFDPGCSGTGLLRGGKLEKEIWEEFSGDRVRLASIASAIRAGVKEVSPPAGSEEAAIDEEDEFPEGRILTQLHKRRERNPSATRKKKQKVLNDIGSLSCEICDFDFYAFYGDIGLGFAECHHRIPLSDLPSVKISRLQDLAVVCANCHRMLHRSRPWKTVEELKASVKR